MNLTTILDSESFTEIPTKKEKNLLNWENMLEGNLLLTLAETKDNADNLKKFTWSTLFSKKNNKLINDSF